MLRLVVVFRQVGEGSAVGAERGQGGATLNMRGLSGQGEPL